MLKREELPSTGKFGDRYELLPIPAFTLKDSLDLEDKVEVKGGDLIQSQAVYGGDEWRCNAVPEYPLQKRE